MNALITFLVILFSVLVDIVLLIKVPSAPPHFDSVWWGPIRRELFNDTSIRPFKIVFDKHMIEDLRYRLVNHRPFTPPLEGEGFDYGFNSDYLHSWVEYWANHYDFQQREDFLNQFPQFMTRIQGLDIHFLWVKPAFVPPNVRVIPLLLLHGFPGSVVEFYKTIPLLTSVSKDRDFLVEVIVPSLPGFGYSESAVRPGLGATEMGVVMRNLMHRLGYHKFYVQGGDYGSYIGLSMATIYPKEILGYHTNLAISTHPKTISLILVGAVYPPLVMHKALAGRMYPLRRQFLWYMTEFGYFHIQAAKPDTVGIAVAESPTGLMAYILQLFSSASRRNFVRRADGGLDDLYTRDELIDNLMMYWVPNSFNTACRIYAETANLRNLAMQITAIPTPVPTWTIHAKDEILYLSPSMLKPKYPNLLQSTVLPTAGHFLALEEPRIFAYDVLKALGAFGRWHWKNLHRHK